MGPQDLSTARNVGAGAMRLHLETPNPIRSRTLVKVTEGVTWSVALAQAVTKLVVHDALDPLGEHHAHTLVPEADRQVDRVEVEYVRYGSPLDLVAVVAPAVLGFPPALGMLLNSIKRLYGF